MIVSLFDDNYVKPGSLQAWLLAARPKTLTGAAVPVMIGSAYAWHQHPHIEIFGWVPLLLCFLFAFLMQIAANLVNDYYDGIRGNDNERRLGPKRAMQQGWVTPTAMRIAIAITLLLACMAGLPLAIFGGAEMIAAGAACVAFCFLYTTLLAGLALGDLLVIVFFGVVPVCCTWWVVTPHAMPLSEGLPQPGLLAGSFLEVALSHEIIRPLLLSIACGLVVDTLLIVNNYRDIAADREAGKRTLVVLAGKRAAERAYLLLPTLALVIVLCLFGWTATNIILTFGVYFLYTGTWNEMRAIGQGSRLNAVLGKTARNILAFGLLVSLLIILA